MRDCLNAHNAKRNLHDAHNLRWDNNLAKGAAAWALQLAKSSALRARSSPHNGQGYRENTYYRYDSPPGKVSTCKATVEAWYAMYYTIFKLSKQVSCRSLNSLETAWNINTFETPWKMTNWKNVLENSWTWKNDQDKGSSLKSSTQVKRIETWLSLDSSI